VACYLLVTAEVASLTFFHPVRWLARKVFITIVVVIKVVLSPIVASQLAYAVELSVMVAIRKNVLVLVQ
jgi:hypothetical protein